MSKTHLTVEQVKQLAERVAEADQPQTYRLRIGEPEFVTSIPDYHYWSIPVDAEGENVRATDFAIRLVDLQEKLRAQMDEEVEVIPDHAFL